MQPCICVPASANASTGTKQAQATPWPPGRQPTEQDTLKSMGHHSTHTTTSYLPHLHTRALSPSALATNSLSSLLSTTTTAHPHHTSPPLARSDALLAAKAVTFNSWPATTPSGSPSSPPTPLRLLFIDYSKTKSHTHCSQAATRSHPPEYRGIPPLSCR